MNSGFGGTPGIGRSSVTGPDGTSLVGGDPLNSALVIIWGFGRACFGVSTLRLLEFRVVNSPAAALEGAQLNISVLGDTVCIGVVRGVTTFCNRTLIPRLSGYGIVGR